MTCRKHKISESICKFLIAVFQKGVCMITATLRLPVWRLLLLKITFSRKWPTFDMHGCTSGTEIAKLCHCSLHGLRIVATTPMWAYIFMVINHSGISFLPAYSSESVQNVAVVLTTSWGINVLRLSLYDSYMAAALSLLLSWGHKLNPNVYRCAKNLLQASVLAQV